MRALFCVAGRTLAGSGQAACPAASAKLDRVLFLNLVLSYQATGSNQRLPF